MAIKEFMARGSERRTEKNQPAEAQTPQRAVGAPPRNISPTTSIDASTEFEGTLRCKQTLRIDGRVKGSVECEKSVIVGEAANVEASIAADEVQISGVAHGDIVAQRKITLDRTAVVIGDITTPGIVIEEGAKVKGRIVIGSDLEPVEDEKPSHEPKKTTARKKLPVTPANHEDVPLAAAPA